MWGNHFAVKRWCQADIKRIWIWIKIGRKGSRSFCQILKAVQILIKILKKDLDPGSSDPPIRSSNSLVLYMKLPYIGPIESIFEGPEILKVLSEELKLPGLKGLCLEPSYSGRRMKSFKILFQ